MEEKIKKVIDNVGIAVLIIIIVTFNLIIGAIYKPLQIFPICVFTGLCLLILFNKKIMLKEKIIKSKVDVCVTIFMITLTLPLIFKTYCSYENTVNYILKYFFVYAVYLLTRSVVNTKKKVNILIATSIFSSLIIIVLGLDLRFGIFGHCFNGLISKLDLEFDRQPDRFASILGYTNAVTIYLTFCVFLAVNRIENCKKNIVKVIYSLYIVLCTYIIYISLSRVVLIVYLVFLLAYLIFKFHNKVKISKKVKISVIATIFIIFILTIVYLVFAMKYSKPAEMKDTPFKFRINLEPSKTYEITLDIEVTDEGEVEDESQKPKLYFYEVNKYFKNSVLCKIDLENNSRQTYVVNLKTSEDVYNLKMMPFYREGRKIVVHSCYINGEEYIFSYKYVPRVISRLITSFNLKDDSIVKRGQFYENCIRIFKDGPVIIGNGGYTWSKLSRVYAEYPYFVKETHSYFFELLICFGIIGVVAFLSLIILFFIKILKECVYDSDKRKYLSVFIGLMIVVLYSFTFDFSMSFVVIILTVFEFIGALQFDNKENLKIKFVDFIILILLGLTFISLGRMCVAKYITKDNSVRKKIAPWVQEYNYKYIRKKGYDDLEAIKDYINKEPYSEQNEIYRLYWDAIFRNVDNLSDNKLENYINFGIDAFERIKMENQMNFNIAIERANTMTMVYNELESFDNKTIQQDRERLKKLIIKEYETNSENIKALNRNYKTLKQSQIIMDRYNEIIHSTDIETN